VPSKRPHKYRAQPTVSDGIRFASKAESRRYQELKLLEKAGEIKELELQPKFPLSVPWYQGHNNAVIGTYLADFRYFRRSRQKGYGTAWKHVVEDVKGFKTPLYRWKKKHVEAQYGLEITEVR
jgi:hypothetical protein